MESKMLKYVSWNVNGLRAVMGKGFEEIFRGFDADCVCLQETKISEGQFAHEFEGYHAFFDYADKKGYSGTAVFSRREPLSVSRGLGIDDHDHEGRVLTLEFDDHFLVNVYTPNSQNELRRLAYRQEWDRAFADYVASLDAKKPVVICGDMNVAHNEIDLKNPKTNHHSAGFSDEERADFTELLARGFVDTFRSLHPDAVEYSWWSYRMRAREKNVGWRIDYFLVSERIAAGVKSAAIRGDIFGSDHCPVTLNFTIL